MCDLLRSSGKTPVVVQKEAPGFIANRLQCALGREAWYIVEQGIASAQDVDIVTMKSFGARMPFGGIFEKTEIQTDYEAISKIVAYMYPFLCSSKEPSPLMLEMVKRGETGSKTGKGFYDWTPESERTRREELNRDLFRLFHELLAKPVNALGEKK
jgi:3-hydroxybutyryl-CoA dehydrogenase